MDDPAATASVRLTKGVHVVISRDRLPVKNALVIGDESGRIVFVMPLERNVLVGTTDTDFSGERDRVAADSDDVRYLLRLLHQSLPGCVLSESDVLSSYAGLRALVHEVGRAPSTVPREETILESTSGMLTVAGGKLTTHRRIAEKVTNLAVRRLSITAKPCNTASTPLPGARGSAPDAPTMAAIPPPLREAVLARYGTRTGLVAEVVREKPDLAGAVSADAPVIAAEVLHAIRNELALTLADFLLRRTSLTWRFPVEAEKAAPAVARLMAAELGWTKQREEAELAQFAADLQTRRAA